jgi:uncharacterized membrane protein
LADKNCLRNLGLCLPKFEFKCDTNIGPLLIIKYKKKKIGFAFCHRRSDSCFRIFGHTSFLCARCTGIMIGFALFGLLSYFNLSIPSIIAFFLALPLIVDGTSQYLGLRTSNNMIRLITGIIFTPGLLTVMEATL